MIVLALVLAATGPEEALAQEPGAVEGCYRFTQPFFKWLFIEPWSTTTFSASSPVVRLHNEMVAHETGRPEARRISVPGLRDPRAMQDWYRHSRWMSGSADSVTISWWNGLSGTMLRLRVSGDRLEGISIYSTDLDLNFAQSPATVQPAFGRRVPCPESPGSS